MTRISVWVGEGQAGGRSRRSGQRAAQGGTLRPQGAQGTSRWRTALGSVGLGLQEVPGLELCGHRPRPWVSVGKSTPGEAGGGGEADSGWQAAVGGWKEGPQGIRGGELQGDQGAVGPREPMSSGFREWGWGGLSSWLWVWPQGGPRCEHCGWELGWGTARGWWAGEHRGFLVANVLPFRTSDPTGSGALASAGRRGRQAAVEGGQWLLLGPLLSIGLERRIGFKS